MLPAAEPDDPLRIEISSPEALPGLCVVSLRSDRRLYRSVKDRVATVFNETGSSEWWARGNTWTSRPGTLQIKLPGEVHRELRRDGPSRFQVVLFDDALLDEARLALGRRPFAPPPRLALEERDPKGAPLARLHALLRAPGADPLALQTALAEALRALVELTGGPTEPDSRRAWGAPVRRALELVRARFTEALSLDDLAEHARLDKFHLCRAFSDHVGLPPYAYITHLRVARAQVLLAQGVPPSEVAARVGLCDQSQLNRHFKRIVGLTPGQFGRGARRTTRAAAERVGDAGSRGGRGRRPSRAAAAQPAL
ncbi:AraC family transcriptional regulator [Sorangium cellulosum]|uniref:AraC family transcriptional regulator n=1 Tax=Sorangium cellulosum TaxID=56 RepID=A0A2L0ET59_SORCE|nr:AraC family transcriptional regulator [Sorangium cellulosum]AUX42462.1 AraC family transcriptional regulator [Sorangium cellulosum]